MKNLDIATLRSFHTVVKYGSVSRASEELFLTQSAISQHVKRLEGLVNLKLFEREGRSIVLTKQGEEFLDETKHLLTMNDALLDKYCYSDQMKIVSVGLSEHLSQRYLPSLLRSCATLSGIKLDVKIGLNGPLYEDLQEEKLDIAVLINERDSLVEKPALMIPQKLCWVSSQPCPTEHEPERSPPFQRQMSLNRPVLGSSGDDDRETSLATPANAG